MKTTPELFIDLLESCFDPVFACKLVALRADAELQAKIDDYADRNTEGKLTPSELEDYRSILEYVGLLSILQARAKLYLLENQLLEESNL